MSRATDQEILAFSLEESAAVVTLDADFHAILAVSLHGSRAPVAVDWVQNVRACFEADLNGIPRYGEATQGHVSPAAGRQLQVTRQGPSAYRSRSGRNAGLMASQLCGS
jgi:hypothetical protein